MHEDCCGNRLHYSMRRGKPSGKLGRRFTAIVTIGVLSLIAFPSLRARAATGPTPGHPAGASAEAETATLTESLGVRFVPGSPSILLLERDGKTYLIDVAGQTIREKESASSQPVAPEATLVAAHSSATSSAPGARIFADNCARCHGAGGQGGGAEKTPDLTKPETQAVLSAARVGKIIRDGKPGTRMPAWSGKLSEDEINSVATFVKTLGPGSNPNLGTSPARAERIAKAYVPADDYLFSMPTGRKLDRHGFYFNFTHRFVGSPAFSGPGGGDTLAGLDDFSISSFGLRYGITEKLSVSVYRSPSLINRPIEFGAAYHFLDEHEGKPLNATFRFSVDGQNDFAKNFTPNFELILSRSVTRHAQLYVAPTVSLQARELTQKPGSIASIPPNLPGFNTFVLGIGGAVDIRPTVALVAEVFPTLVNGPELGIHRPAFAFGIQKRVFRHAFTFGFTTSPGTVVSQRAGTRATFLGQPSADTPGGLFIGFDLMRQIY